MTKNKLKKYNNIFVPQKDTIHLAGPTELFKNFEAKSSSNYKNLLVLYPGIISELGELRRNNSLGAKEFLDYLDENKNKINYNESNEDYINYNILNKLDVAVMKNSDFNKNSFKNLESKINSFWTSVDKDSSMGRPKFISNVVEERLLLEYDGLIVDKPNFLLVDANIVKKGILVGSNKFAEKIYSSKNGEMSLNQAIDLLNPEDGKLYPNQFICIRGEQDNYAKVVGEVVRSSLGKIVDYKNPKVKLLKNSEYNKKIKMGNIVYEDILGIKPLDMEQYLALQYGLFDEDVTTFFLTGSQGSGKTLLSYVAAIDQVLWYDSNIAKEKGYGLDLKNNQKKSKFNNIVLLKPNNLLNNRDIGFLPGDMFEKLKPHLEPYIDAHKESNLYEQFRFEELLAHPRWDNQYFKKRNEVGKINKHAHLPGNSEAFEMTYSGVMRGRSFKDTLVLVDEAQNFTPYELKTIIERVGLGSKAVIMGDPYQVDVTSHNKNCSREMNGLTHAIKHFLPENYSALVHLQKNYRSQMSEDAISWKVYSY
ncbi:MAG: PhoH family protein [Candidatus Woesearchaeota archaeon]